MHASDARVTARQHRTPDGEVHREYLVGNVAYGSHDALQRALAEA